MTNVLDDLVRAGTYTPNLPAELWLQIIGHLKDSTDIYNLSQVSSTLRALSLSTFKTLNLFPPEPATSAQIRSLGFRILCALQTPALACIVKDLSVTLSCFQVRGSAPRNCACDSLDRALGLALRAMTNLEALDILCIMCVRSVNGRHAYLDTPDAPGQHVTQLRTLSFRCRCCTYTPPTHPNTFESPLFNNVETLRWMTGTRLPALPGGSQFEGLPQLKALAYYGRVVENSLLEARPIQRLYVVDLYRSRARFIRALEVSAKSLTHVIYENLVGLKDILDEKRRSYPNVCHIGTLPAFPVNEVQVNSHIKGHADATLDKLD